MNIDKIILEMKEKEKKSIKKTSRHQERPLANIQEGQEIIDRELEAIENFEFPNNELHQINDSLTEEENSKILQEKENNIFLTHLLKKTFRERKIKKKSSASMNIHFQKPIQDSLKVVDDVNGLIKCLKHFSEAYRRSCKLDPKIYEEIVRLTLKFGYLNWAAAIISEMEDRNIEISFNIVNEFLQMTYIKNLFKNYYTESDDENSLMVSQNEKEKEKEKEKKKRKYFIKYMKKLNLNSEEFKPKRYIQKDSNKFLNKNSNGFYSSIEKEDQKILYRKKLRNPKEVQEFNHPKKESKSMIKTSAIFKPFQS